MLPTYNPRAWYWRADDGRLYSSEAQKQVSADDGAFTAWSDAGNFPTSWPRDNEGAQSQAALDEVLREARVLTPVVTYKADLYRRATDTEAEKIEEALAAAPVRQRRLFEAAQYLAHADPEFAAMHAALVGLFGESRADELLAAS